MESFSENQFTIVIGLAILAFVMACIQTLATSNEAPRQQVAVELPRKREEAVIIPKIQRPPETSHQREFPVLKPGEVYLCRHCRIAIETEEFARSHAQGKKHRKKSEGKTNISWYLVIDHADLDKKISDLDELEKPKEIMVEEVEEVEEEKEEEDPEWTK